MSNLNTTSGKLKKQKSFSLFTKKNKPEEKDNVSELFDKPETALSRTSSGEFISDAQKTSNASSELEKLHATAMLAIQDAYHAQDMDNYYAKEKEEATIAFQLCKKKYDDFIEKSGVNNTEIKKFKIRWEEDMKQLETEFEKLPEISNEE
ncbi:hypothetical protein [Parasitella parasitica]|uniref:Uncharacterized protein n=1 Tax=Parasitella parasitica TaxID=35722 RepID=A0A0B7NKL5_9FUNG|nr:hypothetical protein [Parasitella parasitica]